MMRDDTDVLTQISRWQREEARRLGISIPSIVEPVPNHTDLAEKIATARHWERLTGVKTPTFIEQIIQSWELDR